MRFIPMVAQAALFFSLLSSAALSQTDPLAGGGVASDKSAITIGSADFPESQIIATIYAKALSAKGIKVERHPNIGSREVYFPALRDGSIDLIPEYGGAALRYLDKDSKENSPDDVLAALEKAIPNGIRVLKASQAQDSNPSPSLVPLRRNII
ncbi:glycine betaine ABC transporter substrate-binding protein [Rhizobium rhizogenes]|uniref:glycine betaine ABC transporter substrate-binding protein n=1 Tax=Rhizobium rhizogenes TaxID=359 RepID=UPI0022854BCC|nr:glycine betaine ABC transporter substrate-binding protein [Rhizobium rhizogenes]